MPPRGPSRRRAHLAPARLRQGAGVARLTCVMCDGAQVHPNSEALRPAPRAIRPRRASCSQPTHAYACLAEACRSHVHRSLLLWRQLGQSGRGSGNRSCSRPHGLWPPEVLPRGADVLGRAGLHPIGLPRPVSGACARLCCQRGVLRARPCRLGPDHDGQEFLRPGLQDQRGLRLGRLQNCRARARPLRASALNGSATLAMLVRVSVLRADRRRCAGPDASLAPDLGAALCILRPA